MSLDEEHMSEQQMHQEDEFETLERKMEGLLMGERADKENEQKQAEEREKEADAELEAEMLVHDDTCDQDMSEKANVSGGGEQKWKHNWEKVKH